jgi:two-component system cell cycle sensor histidine kinase/response regulator CckA
MAMVDDQIFKLLCQSLGFMFVAVDRALKIVFWNHKAAEYFGQTDEQMIGRNFLDILKEPERPEAQQLFDAALTSHVSGEMEIHFQQGEEPRKTLVLIASPIIDATGQCIGASASIRDITERKRLSKELAKSRRMGSLGKMASAITHHFNNILGGMMTTIDASAKSESARELRNTMRSLAQAIGRATRITKQLSAFAASENQQDEWGELGPVVERFIRRLQRQTEAVGIHLVTRIDAIPSGPFEANRLMSVLESLAQNSIDAMPKGGTLTIEMTEQMDSAVIVLTDTGSGIPEDALDHLFEPFFTTKGELGAEGVNIGLGLAAVHGLVTEMGGTISITSKVGKGTQVRLRFPLHRDGESPNAQLAPVQTAGGDPSGHYS